MKNKFTIASMIILCWLIWLKVIVETSLVLESLVRLAEVRSLAEVRLTEIGCLADLHIVHLLLQLISVLRRETRIAVVHSLVEIRESGSGLLLVLFFEETGDLVRRTVSLH